MASKLLCSLPSSRPPSISTFWLFGDLFVGGKCEGEDSLLECQTGWPRLLFCDPLLAGLPSLHMSRAGASGFSHLETAWVWRWRGAVPSAQVPGEMGLGAPLGTGTWGGAGHGGEKASEVVRSGTLSGTSALHSAAVHGVLVTGESPTVWLDTPGP